MKMKENDEIIGTVGIVIQRNYRVNKKLNSIRARVTKLFWPLEMMYDGCWIVLSCV